MTELVERVAKALAIAGGMHPEAVSNDEDEIPAWTLYLKDARAAIEAMREPTEAMQEAGYHVRYARANVWDNTLLMWKAMIDAALSPKKGTTE